MDRGAWWIIVHWFANNLISGSSAFSKTSLNVWKFTVHVLPKPGLENFVHFTDHFSFQS